MSSMDFVVEDNKKKHISFMEKQKDLIPMK